LQLGGWGNESKVSCPRKQQWQDAAAGHRTWDLSITRQADALAACYCLPSIPNSKFQSVAVAELGIKCPLEYLQV